MKKGLTKLVPPASADLIIVNKSSHLPPYTPKPIGFHFTECKPHHPSLNQNFLTPVSFSTTVPNVTTAIMGRVSAPLNPPTKDTGSALQRFVEFSKLMIVDNFDPVNPDTIESPNEWLENSTYSRRQKNAILKMAANLPNHVEKDEFLVKAFIKSENYMKNDKYPRLILALSPAANWRTGRFIRAIQNQLKSSRFSIKGVDPKDWPALMQSVLGNEKVVETDYTAMESHHKHQFAQVSRFFILHMLRSVPERNWIQKYISRLMSGTNQIKLPAGLRAELPERLMSGAMWTSLQNWVLNLCLSSFIALQSKYPDDDPRQLSQRMGEFHGLFEGDDGIFNCENPDDQLIADLTIKLKFEQADHYMDAGFCGIRSHPANIVDSKLQIVADPLKALVNFFFFQRKFLGMGKSKLLALLRCKALSGMNNYCHCPILGKLYEIILYRTRGRDPRAVIKQFDMHTRDRILNAIENTDVTKIVSRPSPAARILVQERFGISIAVQLLLEDTFETQRHTPSFNPVFDNLLIVPPWMVEHTFKKRLFGDTEVLDAYDIQQEILDIIQKGGHTGKEAGRLKKRDVHYERYHSCGLGPHHTTEPAPV